MDSRLDFSDLAGLMDVPEIPPANPFESETLTLDDLDDLAPGGDGAATAPPPPPSVAPELATRCLAKLVDGAVALLFYGLVSAFFSSWFHAFFLGGLAASVYFLVSDGLDVDFMRRRSLGKRVMGLTVECIDGTRCTLAGSVQRNWMFTVIFFAQAFTFVAPAVSVLIVLAALGLVGYETYWIVTNPNGIRWGDDLAGTEVLQPVPAAKAAAR